MIDWGLGERALRVVAVGAHPDDIEIGCGGTLLRFAARGQVSLRGLVVTGSPARADEARSALPRFVPGAEVTVADLPDGRLPAVWDSVKQALEDFASDQPADIVLAPRADDAHQDHRLLGQLVTTVWRDSQVLHYELPKWDGDLSRPSTFVGLTNELARHKVALLNESFPSQKDRDWWDEEMFLGLMRIRGMECRRPYAEAFQAPKLLLDLGGTPTQTERAD